MSVFSRRHTTPQTIPLNSIDRSYLIPEEDGGSVYFPMSILTVTRLKTSVQPEQAIDILRRLAKKHPLLRLGYALDVTKQQWTRLDDAALDSHLEACVSTIEGVTSIEQAVSQAIRVNNQQISQPVNVLLWDNYLLLRMHHSFGDGKFLFLLTQYLLAELQEKQVTLLPLSERWWMPLWRVVWQNPLQGVRVLWKFIQSSLSYYQDFQNDTRTNTDNPVNQRPAIVSGSPMCTAFATLEADALEFLHTVRGDVSLNTLLQVIIESHLHESGLITRPTTYTLPVDLRRYMNDKNRYYAGNMASQVRIRLDHQGTPIERAAALNDEIQRQLVERMPLASLPGEWLMLLGGRKTYEKVNREWLLKSVENDPRFFVLTNLGNTDSVFQPVDAFLLHADFAPRLFVPLMGGPPLVISFNMMGSKGHLAVTYDPHILSSQHITFLFHALTLSALQKLLG